MFIVLMLPLDKSFHKVKCYSLTVTQASGTTASNVVRREKNHGFKSVWPSRFIHLFIYSFNSFQKTNKQAKKTSKQLPEGRWADRPTADDRRPTADDRPPTIDDRPPTIDDRPPTIDDRPSTIDDRPTDRPSLLDDARSFGYSVGYSFFFHFDSRLSMSDDRLSTVENSIVIFVHFGAPYSIAIASK